MHCSNETAKVEEEEEMNISQEILVLDFGDEKNHDFLRSDPSADFGKGNFYHHTAKNVVNIN